MRETRYWFHAARKKNKNLNDPESAVENHCDSESWMSGRGFNGAA